MATRGPGDPYGTHRVLRPKGLMPQAAELLDVSLPIWDNELLIDVATLNIDSASFRQMREAAGGDRAKVGETVAKTVAASAVSTACEAFRVAIVSCDCPKAAIALSTVSSKSIGSLPDARRSNSAASAG